MTNKKNNLITFFVSLIPGAGEMYLGFYKHGISIMLLFFGSIALFGTLFPPVFYLLPVPWFYSFFHTHNLSHMPDEEFYSLEDDYLFHIRPQNFRHMSKQNRNLMALLLILMGISMIWNHLWKAFWRLFSWLDTSSVLFSLLHYWIQAIPQLAAAILIIWIGVQMIRDKRDSLNFFSAEYETYDSWNHKHDAFESGSSYQTSGGSRQHSSAEHSGSSVQKDTDPTHTVSSSGQDDRVIDVEYSVQEDVIQNPGHSDEKDHSQNSGHLGDESNFQNSGHSQKDQESRESA